MIELTGGEQAVADSAMIAFQVTAREQYEKGIEKYGTVLKSMNGRDAGKDLMQELVDAVMYARQLDMEFTAVCEILYEFVDQFGEHNIPEKVMKLLESKAHPDGSRKWGLTWV